MDLSQRISLSLSLFFLFIPSKTKNPFGQNICSIDFCLVIFVVVDVRYRFTEKTTSHVIIVPLIVQMFWNLWFAATFCSFFRFSVSAYLLKVHTRYQSYRINNNNKQLFAMGCKIPPEEMQKHLKTPIHNSINYNGSMIFPYPNKIGTTNF